MEKRYIKVISLFLVFILLSVSCSNGTKETEMGIQENNAEEVVGNDENLPKESLESEEADVEVTEAEEEIEIIEPTESEVELFNQLAGGFFYTKDSGDDYSEMRKESIDLFIDQMITVLEDGYDFYTGGIKSYEDKLLLFIGNIDGSRTEYNDDFQYIINRMMGYKTQLNTLAAQSNGYFEKIENYANDDVSKAVIYSNIFETTVKFYEKLDGYLLFLESTSEYLATGIIEDFNKDYALTLRQHTAEVFEQEILPDIIEVIKAYDQMALTYTLINSGDYYYTKSISKDIIAQLESLEDVEGIVEIKDEFIQEMNNPSSYILTIQNEEETSFRIPFIKIAYAEEHNIAEYDNSLEVYKFIHKLSINPNITEKELDEALMSLVLQKHNVHIEEKKSEIEETKKEDPELLRPETILALGGEKLMAMAGADKVYAFVSIEGSPITPWKINENGSGKKDEIEASKIQQEVKKEVINQEKREKMIEKLKSIQNSGESFAGSFLMSLSADIGGKVVYDKVIKSFTDVLAENKDKMGQETFEQLENILENDLEEILGSKKVDFANKFLNGSAEEIVNSFTDWVNDSSNRKDLEINKNTLISVLDAMGFEHEGELEEIINGMVGDAEEIDDTENSANASNESFDLEGKEAILLDYLSYMLPLMDNVDHEGLKKRADQLNISKEEFYIYAMSTLVIGTKNIVGGDDELLADEKRATEGLKNILEGGEMIDPWVKDYCFNMFYELFNEKGDLDRWRNFTDEEKQELINDALNDDSNDEEN